MEYFLDRRVPAQGGSRGGAVCSSLHTLGAFDGATIRTIGKAFDAACNELRDGGQPAVVHEVMIKRIIAAARKGERNVTQLRDAALTDLREPRNQFRGGNKLADFGERGLAQWL